MAKRQQETRNPENLDDIKALDITDEIKTFVTELCSEVEEEQTNRGFWEQNVDKYKRLRYGIRKKKTQPWKGAANFSLPLIDTDIARVKPAYVQLMNITPVVAYIPYGSEDVDPARNREQLMDWRLRTQVKPFQQYCYGIDYLLEQGATLYKTGWKFTTGTYTEFINIADFPQDVQEALYDVRMKDDTLFQIIQESFDINLDFE